MAGGREGMGEKALLFTAINYYLMFHPSVSYFSKTIIISLDSVSKLCQFIFQK